ncbi:MAG TPA: YbaB/EbfC family nucleoid-associated protein [Egibacteraceae bacterium]|nr:YbaB/EbfC family nucleoid-associated protein [Egibacteraceae bacterium]
MSNMNQVMRQAQAMQRKLKKAQDELAAMEFSGSAGGGMVKATVSGDGRLSAVQIDKAAVDPDDVELLQDMVVAAVTEAMRSRTEAEERLLGPIAGGLGVPGLGL